MKKKIFLTIWLFSLVVNNIFASKLVPDLWLPWKDGEVIINESLPNLISNFIQYIAVVAVIALMISWILYLISAWEEEKVKKAKNWVIRSLVWVIVSLLAFSIVTLITKLKI